MVQGVAAWHQTLLMILADQGLINHIKYLLNSNIVLNVNEAGLEEQSATPLHRAAKLNSVCVALLLEAGADVNSVDDEHATPLHYACTNNETTTIIDLLLAHGANVCARTLSGSQPLHRAWSAKVIRRLLEYGADVNALTSDECNALLTFSPPVKWNCEQNDLLMSTLDALQTLLDAGIDRNISDKFGRTPVTQLAIMMERVCASLMDSCVPWVLRITAFLLSKDVPINPIRAPV